jgi:FimV-like protein
VLIRAFIIAITIAAIWWPLRSFGLGLGLGDASVESTLSSPLRVDIPLRGMEGLRLDPEKFSIEIEDSSRPNMKYRLERIDADNAIIVLYTRQMVTEPLVHFRLKVKWEKSAIARSYDVFIDPPAYQFSPPEETVASNASDVTSADTSDPVAQEVSEPVPEPIAINPPVGEAEVDSKTESEIGKSEGLASEVADEIAEQRREYGPTIDGNSIWRVARAVSTDNGELTIYQWMYGIWKANPQAFSRSNMHRLNMGELLSIPLEREIAETSHLQSWRTYSSQMAMLQPAPQTREVAQDDVQRTDVAVEVTPAITDRVSSTDSEGIATVDESTPRDSHQSEVAVNAEPAFDVIEGGGVDASIAATIANLEKIEASIDVEEVEASIVADSVSSADAEVFESSDVIFDLLEDADAGSETAATIVQSVSPAETLLPSATGEVVPQAVAVGSLEARMEYVAGLPIIGSDAPLAFVGRTWQRADEFISNSPSWAAMAFGGWITLVLMMFMQEFRSRRGATAMEKRSDDRPLTRDAALQEAKRIAATVAADAASSEGEKEAAQENSSIEAESNEAQVGTESNQSRVERGPDRRASDRRETATPVQPQKISFNSDEILEKADGFMASGDSSEAVKLLELTVKLQPDRLNLVLRLLEIYYLLKDDEAFEILVDRFKPALQVMEIGQQIDLQVMYSKLCPESPPLLDPDKATDLDDDSDYKSRGDGEAAAGFDGDVDLFTADQANHYESAVNEEVYVATQVIEFNNGVVLDEDSTATSGMVGEAIDIDVTLQEVDVYLAYGLYGNAEELLHKVKAVYPGRADLMARLLDSYYATGNLVDFEAEAEILKSMGDAADPYWEKVLIMGYELAPYNKMFAEGKDKSLGAFELETARPELPDFNLAAVEEFNGLSSAEAGLSGDGIEAELGEFSADGDEIDLDEAGIALDDDTDLDVSELVLDDDEIDLDEVALDDDEIDLDEVTLDDDDATLDNLDIAAALSETNLNLELETGWREAEEKLTRKDHLSDNAVHANDDEVVADVDDDDEEIMKFTIPEEPEQSDSSPSVDDGGSVAVCISADEDDAEIASLDSRILYFPDGGSDKVKAEQFEELVSEVKMTLQTMRDQLQNLTERQYRQERDTHELHKSVAKLSDSSPEPARNERKKLS